MNILVAYFSKFGNTQKLADLIAGSLEILGPVRLICSDNLAAADMQWADLVVMGTPTHKMNLPENVKPVLAAFPRKILEGKQIAAFDTSYQMNAFLNLFVASRRLDRNLRRLGGKRVMKPEIFVVGGREGPLAEGELERAAAWSEQIVRRVHGGLSVRVEPQPAASAGGITVE